MLTRPPYWALSFALGVHCGGFRDTSPYYAAETGGRSRTAAGDSGGPGHTADGSGDHRDGQGGSGGASVLGKAGRGPADGGSSASNVDTSPLLGGSAGLSGVSPAQGTGGRGLPQQAGGAVDLGNGGAEERGVERATGGDPGSGGSASSGGATPGPGGAEGRGGTQVAGNDQQRGGEPGNGGDPGSSGSPGSGGQVTDAGPDVAVGPEIEAEAPKDFRKFLGKYKFSAAGGYTCPDANHSSTTTPTDVPLEIKLGDGDSDVVVITNPLPARYPGPCTIKMNAEGSPLSDMIKAVPSTTCTSGTSTIRFNQTQDSLFGLIYKGDGRLDLAVKGQITEGPETCTFGYNTGTAVPTP